MKPRHIVAAILAILLLYPLSLGPATWIAMKLPLDRRSAFDAVTERLYRPLAFVIRHCPAIEAVLRRYTQLWEPPTPPEHWGEP